MGYPIYQGANSCYAKREGVYVKRIRKPGIDTVAEAVAIAYLILRDYRRGYSYEHDCSKMPMTEELFEKRLNYIITLAHKHGATKSEIQRIAQIVTYVKKKKRLPRQLLKRAKKMLVRKRRRRTRRKKNRRKL